MKKIPIRNALPVCRLPKIFSFCLILFISLNLQAQYTFQKKYDVSTDNESCPNNAFERIKAVAHDANSGDYYFSGGYVKSGNQCLLMTQGALGKTNSKGELQWVKRIPYHGYYGDIKCVYDANHELSGLIAAGASNSADYRSATKFELIRTDENGALMHHKSYGEPNGICEKVQVALDDDDSPHGFIAVGTLQHDARRIYVVRTDDDLSVMWDKEIYVDGVDCEGFSVIQTNDKGFLLCGSIGNEAWIIKLDGAGNIQWDYAFRKTGYDIYAKDLVEVMNGANPEYFVLGSAKASSFDLLLIHIDDNGSLINDARFDLGSTDLPSGIISVSGGNLVLSATRAGEPVIAKVNSALTSTTFIKKYSNTYDVSPVIAADQGFIIGGSQASTGSKHFFYLVKTLNDGTSDCYEADLTASLVRINLLVGVTDFTTAAVSSSDDIDDLTSLSATELVICKDFCRGINPTTGQATVQVCYGVPTAINEDCGPGNTVKWYLYPDMTTVVSTGTLNVTVTSSTTYVRHCFNADGCLLYETFYFIEPSAAPVEYPHSIVACYGENITLPNPCGSLQTVYLTPSGTANERVFSNQTYTVNCVDINGCVVEKHVYTITVDPPMAFGSTVNVCDGDVIMLDNYAFPFAVCSWTDQNNNPVAGNALFVMPVGSWVFHGTCTTSAGCILLLELTINVTWCDEGGGEAFSSKNSPNSYRNIAISPNPGSDIVKLTVPLSNGERYTMTIRDILGKAVMSTPDNSDNIQSIDISELPAGVYYVEVQIGSELIRKKLVKQ